jgi:hypothetical protein
MAARAPDLTPEQAGEINARELAVLSRSTDHKEALAAFAGKREPKFHRE